jgi:dolichol-phosphate mannosyltransferase
MAAAAPDDPILPDEQPGQGPPAVPAPSGGPLARPFALVATYNERANIELLGPAILALEPPASLLVVDDASPDGTAQAVEALAERFPGRVHLLRRPGKLGYGTAFAEGIGEALRLGATAIVSLDADRSHDPADIPPMLAAMEREGWDVVVGSRYLGGVRVLNWPVYRLLLSVFANRYAGLLLGLKVTDATSGFRAYRAEVFAKADPRHVKARGYAFLVETLYRARRGGARIGEHPIVFSERRDGQSKMSKWVILEAALRPWQLLALRLLGRL